MKQFILAILVCVGMCIGVVGCGSEAVECDIGIKQ